MFSVSSQEKIFDPARNTCVIDKRALKNRNVRRKLKVCNFCLISETLPGKYTHRYLNLNGYARESTVHTVQGFGAAQTSLLKNTEKHHVWLCPKKIYYAVFLFAAATCWKKQTKCVLEFGSRQASRTTSLWLLSSWEKHSACQYPSLIKPNLPWTIIVILSSQHWGSM